ncbi:hypothetical protein BDFB_014370 [Asbolus verrucosus]|uniref:Uncharacterized protein n=1 Tax=Asbolus verrucosus TaxID=1661398 RepID=A0A482VDI7_ASBVE|nr:hypothetical protein BDFB_014370 [Asbolus verrucosus]
MKIEEVLRAATLNLLPQKSRNLCKSEYQFSTAWCKFRNATLVAKNNVDISTYPKLKAFLKKQFMGYKPKGTFKT